jgi:hypothetical protein
MSRLGRRFVLQFPATIAVQIFGDNGKSRLAASCPFQRSLTAFASPRAAASETCRLALVAMSRPRVRTPMLKYRLPWRRIPYLPVAIFQSPPAAGRIA